MITLPTNTFILLLLVAFGFGIFCMGFLTSWIMDGTMRELKEFRKKLTKQCNMDEADKS